MTFAKRMLGLGVLTATLALASGCSDYTYFNVSVYLNQQDRDDNVIDGSILGQIKYCGIAVFAGNRQIEGSVELTEVNGNPVCKANYSSDLLVVDNTKVMKVGVLDYSTARQSGDIKFVVTVRRAAGEKQEVIAQGSASAGVSPGKVLEVPPLIINACKTSEHAKGQDNCQDIR